MWGQCACPVLRLPTRQQLLPRCRALPSFPYPPPCNPPALQAGWELLAKDGSVFKCYSNPWDARYYSDSGASLLVLKAGHNLDTLLVRYQGVDWWSQKSWNCNER